MTNPINQLINHIELELSTQGNEILLDSKISPPDKGDLGGCELSQINQQVQSCKQCSLHKTKTNYVFGQGNPNAKIMFIGEAPGAEENEQGKPFVGPAGQLLTKMIEAIGLKREEVYITNILKCHPPENRDPKPDEIQKCFPYVQKQIETVKPKVICALGAFAAQTLLNTEEPITSLRTKTHEYKGIKVIPTFHPAYLIRNPDKKKLAWEDLQLLLSLL